jgi:hypothetical protein
MIVWPNEIIGALARRRAVIVLGSGVSRNSTNAEGHRPATWEEFLRKCNENAGNLPHVDELINGRNYLTACEILKRRLTADTFIDFVQREYQGSGYTHARIHELIYNLDATIVASPNFDAIYDTYAQTVSAGTVVVKNHTSQDIANYLLGGDNRLILKTHGTANDPANLIFTHKDYSEARTKHVLFYEILKSLVLTHTFFFVGCGTDDPDIRMLFEDVRFAHGRMPFHFMTLPLDEVHDDVLEMHSQNMRVKFLKYSPADGHAELTESLEKLVELVDEKRERLAQEQGW